MILRPYQQKAVEEIRTHFRSGARSVLLCAPTGSGKTILASYILNSARVPSLFLVHRRELIIQAKRAGIPRVASVRSRNFDTPGIIVWDECHHIAAHTWSALYDRWPHAYHIGLSATPQRADGQGLGKWFQHLVQGPTPAELIQAGYLAPFRLFAPAVIDATNLHTKMGDYDRKELAQVADRPVITGQAYQHWRKLAPNKQTLIRCVNREHSRNVAAQFQSVGVNAHHVDGDTPPHLRDRLFEDFAAGRIKVIMQVDLVNEGLDIKGIEAVLDLRPTQSLALWLQFCGRALRPSPGKTAIILDAAGNAMRHGFPDDQREWTLAGKKKRSGPTLSVRICPACFGAMRSGAVTCEYCFQVLPVEPREIATKEGELTELDRTAIRKQQKREESQARTLDDWLRIASARNYDPKWAHIRYNIRQGKRI